MKMPVAPQQYIIQIDFNSATRSARGNKGAAAVEVSQLQRLLSGTGIELDASYRPVCINPQQQRFVVRGQATPDAKKRAERKLGEGIKFFTDARAQTYAPAAPAKSR